MSGPLPAHRPEPTPTEVLPPAGDRIDTALDTIDTALDTAALTVADLTRTVRDLRRDVTGLRADVAGARLGVTYAAGVLRRLAGADPEAVADLGAALERALAVLGGPTPPGDRP